MQAENQWRAFVETGDIRHYLLYKQQQPVATATKETQKEPANGINRNASTGITGSEIPRSR